MSGKTKIPWADVTWSPTTGCTPVSSGCANCYAARMAKRLAAMGIYPKDDPFRVQLWPDRLDTPGRWSKPKRVFVDSMGDLFHEQVPDVYLDRVFTRMVTNPKHTYLILTKRPERMARFLQSWTYGPTLAQYRIWLGVSVEDQKTADERIPVLLEIPAAVRFVSVEPMLGPVDISPWLGGHDAIETNRGVRLSSGSEWGVGNRRRREDLESREQEGRPLEGRHTNDPVPPTQSGASSGGLSTCTGDDSGKTSDGTCPQTGMVSFLRADTERVDRESRERDKDRESQGEFESGDLHRTDTTCHPSAGVPQQEKRKGAISWVICGCETGPGRRQINANAIADLRDQCVAAGVPFFLKQAQVDGKIVHMPDIDGKVWAQFPEVK